MSADIVERLEEESVRLSGHSLDRGSADAGIAANVASEAAETITSLRARLAKADEAEVTIERLTKERDDARAIADKALFSARAADAFLKADAAQLAKARETLDGAYEERNRVVAALARLFPSGLKSTDIMGWDPAWHGCVYIDLPTGQASWHFHEREQHLFDGLPAYDGDWDGHDTPEKYRRLAALAPTKTEAELRHECAASGRHDHDGCDCSAEELARRAALAPGKDLHK